MLQNAHNLLPSGLPFLGEPFDTERLALSVSKLPSLPAAFFSGAYEVRLHATAAPTDFELCLRRSPELEVALKEWDCSQASDATWARALRMVQRWATAGDHWLEPVPVLWVEIDTEPTPRPFLVFTIDPEEFHPNDRLDPSRLLEFTRKLIPAVAGKNASGAQSTLATLCDHLPSSAQVLHLAVRPRASSDFLRVVTRMPWEQLTPALVPLGFRGAADLNELLKKLCVNTLVNSFNLDLGEELRNRVGVEFHFQSSPIHDSRWRHVFDTLETLGVCDVEKRRALEAWYTPDLIRGSSSPNRVLRDLLLKVVFEQGKPLLAKAYLPFSTPELLVR